MLTFRPRRHVWGGGGGRCRPLPSPPDGCAIRQSDKNSARRNPLNVLFRSDTTARAPLPMGGAGIAMQVPRIQIVRNPWLCAWSKFLRLEKKVWVCSRVFLCEHRVYCFVFLCVRTEGYMKTSGTRFRNDFRILCDTGVNFIDICRWLQHSSLWCLTEQLFWFEF